jgi:hypothetical protein
MVVTVDCAVAVKALGMSAYRYIHHSREEWLAGQLQSLQAQTDDNGGRFAVSAVRQGGALLVERTAPAATTSAAAAFEGFRGPAVSREALPAGLLPTSQWNVSQVQQTSLLNTQYGTIARVQVVALGRETVPVGTASVSATRYRYRGDLRMDQWFDDRGRWVKGTFTAFDGSLIEYILQE